MLVTQPAVCGGLSSEDGGRMNSSPRDKVQPIWAYGIIGDLNRVRTSEKLEDESSLADIVGVEGWLAEQWKRGHRFGESAVVRSAFRSRWTGLNEAVARIWFIFGILV